MLWLKNVLTNFRLVVLVGTIVRIVVEITQKLKWIMLILKLLSFIVIPLHVGTYSGTKCRASRVHGAT